MYRRSPVQSWASAVKSSENKPTILLEMEKVGKGKKASKSKKASKRRETRTHKKKQAHTSRTSAKKRDEEDSFALLLHNFTNMLI